MTRLWLKGGADISGNGVVNAAQKPTNLLIYGMPPNYYPGVPGALDVKVRGNGQFYGAIYAPEAAITLGGAGASGEVFGSLIGKTVTMDGNGTKIHYDEALAEIEGGVHAYRLSSWTQTR